LGKLPFRCLKPALFGENVGESEFYPVLKPWPTAAFPATEKALVSERLTPDSFSF